MANIRKMMEISKTKMENEWLLCPLIPYCYTESKEEIRCAGVQYPPIKSAGESARDFISQFIKNMKVTVVVSHPIYYWDSWDDLSGMPKWNNINLSFDRNGFSFSELNGAYRQIDLEKERFEDCVPPEALEYGAVAIFLGHLPKKEIKAYAGIKLEDLPAFCSIKNSTLLYADEDAFQVIICGGIKSSLKRKFAVLVVKRRLEVVATEWYKSEGIYQQWVDEGWAILKKDWSA